MSFNLHCDEAVRPELIAGAPETPLLMLSMRRISDLVAYSQTYEFEDVLQATTGADCVLAAKPRALEWSRRCYRYARLLSGSNELARRATPRTPSVRLDRDYEAFVAFFNDPFEIQALACVPDWRSRCRRATCVITEAWGHLLPDYLLEMLASFDHVFIGVSTPVKEVQRLSGAPCSYLPFAADVPRFSPYPDLPVRNIDLCNIGRRSVITHDALLRAAAQRRLFYYYDTVAGGANIWDRSFRVHDPAAHRLMLANILRRSRYFIANLARVNEPKYLNGAQEISGRFYEGAAAGAVLLGVAPDTESFRAQFGWTDAALVLPFDCPDIDRRIAELDADPERLARISRNNALHAAQSHDWLHRIDVLFATLGLSPTPGMEARRTRLNDIVRAAS